MVKFEYELIKSDSWRLAFEIVFVDISVVKLVIFGRIVEEVNFENE